MAEEYGIEETKEMVGFVISLGEGVAKAVEDGFSLDDIVYFLEALTRAPAAFENMAAIPSELKDLSGEEAQALKDYIAEDFDIPNDKLEDVIERALQLAADLYEFLRGLFPELFEK